MSAAQPGRGRRVGALLLSLVALLGIGGCGDNGSRRAAPKAEPEPAAQFARVSADTLAHGERLARVLGCYGCHGEDLTGEDWSEPGFGRLWTANLTRAVPNYDDGALVRAIAGGLRHDGAELWEMPSWLFTTLSEPDMAALIAFLRSRPATGPVRPLPAFEAGARREIAAGTFTSSRAQVRERGRRWPPDAGPSHALARYIVRATCAECHGVDLRGRRPNPEATPRPDLAIAAAYTREDFRRLMRTGVAAGERQLDMMSGVARGRYAHFSDAEIDAVHAYLQARAQLETD